MYTKRMHTIYVLHYLYVIQVFAGQSIYPILLGRHEEKCLHALLETATATARTFDVTLPVLTSLRVWRLVRT
jgi:hypothetical protein